MKYRVVVFIYRSHLLVTLQDRLTYSLLTQLKVELIMAVILQVDFPFSGPFGEEMSNALMDLAKSINEEPGFMWKIWTENQAEQSAGGVYMFADESTASAYLTMHTERLGSFGITDVRGKIFSINNKLTAINHGATG